MIIRKVLWPFRVAWLLVGGMWVMLRYPDRHTEKPDRRLAERLKREGSSER